MPECPELYLSSQFINSICKGRLFHGKVRKNPIHKCAEIFWDKPAYVISAESRGKEIKVSLESIEENGKKLNRNAKNASNSKTRLQILFSFGMSGGFDFTTASQLPKHAHLSFFTKSEPTMALSFVDPRRFGKWQACTDFDWSPNRGPCVISEYPHFRSNVLNNLDVSAFNKPLCEVMLNQKFFNGIGNYLRAEIIYRAGLRPFDHARSVFAALPDVPEDIKVKIQDKVMPIMKAKPKVPNKNDILELCSRLPQEVVELGTTRYRSKKEYDEDTKFHSWLQCYLRPGMKTILDHNKRTLWFHGDPGPLLPKETGNKPEPKKRSKQNDGKPAKKLKVESPDADNSREVRKTQDIASCDLQTKSNPGKKLSKPSRKSQKLKKDISSAKVKHLSAGKGKKQTIGEEVRSKITNVDVKSLKSTLGSRRSRTKSKN